MSSDPPPPPDFHGRNSMSDRQSGFSENVFSDDYAVGGGVGSRNSAYSHDEGNTAAAQSSPDHSANDEYANLHSGYDQQDPFRDTLENQPTGVNSADESRALADYRSSMSISSPSISMIPANSPRALSPYVGQTGPSHAYDMYAQDTGVNVGNINNLGMNNVSSMSDIGDVGNMGNTDNMGNSGMGADGKSSTPPSRPANDEPVPVSGPQHPYFMYPQNTVPDELLEQPTAQIPIGFPGHNAAPPTIPNDFGDIIGPDGHTEQLPPYSRFAPEDYAKEGVSASGGERNAAGLGLPIAAAATAGILSAPAAQLIDASDGTANEAAQGPPGDADPFSRSGSPALASSASQDSLQPPPTPDSQGLLSPPTAMTNAPTNEASVLLMGNASDGHAALGGEKEPFLKRTSTLCGISWMRILLIAVVLILAAVVGGVVGLVVGKHNSGAPAAESTTDPNSAAEYAQLSTSPGEVLDATPISSVPSSLLPVPTGSYALSINNNIKNTTCLYRSHFTWKCLQSGSYGSRVGVSKSRRNTITFGSYNVQGKFSYGAQPPIFHERTLNFSLAEQIGRSDLGPALFARTHIDKLVILPSDALTIPTTSDGTLIATPTASLTELDLSPPNENNFTIGQTSRAGDRPVFCWWNSTLFELFIYLNETANASSPTGTASLGYISDEATSGSGNHDKRIQFDVRSLLERDSDGDDDSSSYYRIDNVPQSYPLASRMIERSRTTGEDVQLPYCEQRYVNEYGELSPPMTNKIYVSTNISRKRWQMLRKGRAYDHDFADSLHLVPRTDESLLDETCSCDSYDDES